MAFQDFWSNVRIGASLVAPQVADSPRFDRGFFEEKLRNATLWLTPRAVEGFSEADFWFLPEAERERLTKLSRSSARWPRKPAPEIKGRGK